MYFKPQFVVFVGAKCFSAIGVRWVLGTSESMKLFSTILVFTNYQVFPLDFYPQYGTIFASIHEYMYFWDIPFTSYKPSVPSYLQK